MRRWYCWLAFLCPLPFFRWGYHRNMPVPLKNLSVNNSQKWKKTGIYSVQQFRFHSDDDDRTPDVTLILLFVILSPLFECPPPSDLTKKELKGENLFAWLEYSRSSVIFTFQTERGGEQEKNSNHHPMIIIMLFETIYKSFSSLLLFVGVEREEEWKGDCVKRHLTTRHDSNGKRYKRCGLIWSECMIC